MENLDFLASVTNFHDSFMKERNIWHQKCFEINSIHDNNIPGYILYNLYIDGNFTCLYTKEVKKIQNWAHEETTRILLSVKNMNNIVLEILNCLSIILKKCRNELEERKRIGLLI